MRSCKTQSYLQHARSGVSLAGGRRAMRLGRQTVDQTDQTRRAPHASDPDALNLSDSNEFQI